MSENKQGGMIALIILVAVIYASSTGQLPSMKKEVDTLTVNQKNPNSYSFEGVGSSYVVLNYTKPIDATSASWRVKIGDVKSEPINLAIPSACFDYSSVLKLKVEATSDYNAGSRATAYCYSGSWIKLTEKTGTKCGPGGDESCSHVDSCTYVSGSLAFDNSYATGITSYQNCNQAQNFFSFNNAGMFWDEEMNWQVPKESAAACSIVFRTPIDDYGSCPVQIAPENRWIVALVDGQLRSFEYSRCEGYGAGQIDLPYKDHLGNSLQYSKDAASKYSLYVKTNGYNFIFETMDDTLADSIATPKEPYTSNNQEVYSPDAVSCPALDKNLGAYCTQNTDCFTSVCTDNKCSIQE